ncbi:DUF6734 family protein [Parasediminibacterium paludis]|uniref:DUF6734 family protein n=1 Tax=Parasediminibacterium paludis TaxID=908966 RepID=A0ABV8PZM6_9BACT
MLGVHSLSTTTLNTNCCGYNSIKDLKNCIQLSAILLKKSTGRIVLYTDNEGSKLVQDFAHLYEDIVVDLDCLNWVQPHNWAFSKLYVFTKIKEPFVHIDNDVFLWDGLPKHFFNPKKVDAFFQGVEHFDMYKHYLERIKTNSDVLPKSILIENLPYAYNCGVVGFNDLSIIDTYYKTAKNYVLKNQQYNWDGIDYDLKNGQPLLFEQWFIAFFCKAKKVDFLLNEDTSPKYQHRYTHLLSTSKKNVQHMQQVERKLKMLKLQTIM